MFIELNRIKKHLNIDSYYTDDDDYLTYLEGVAETVVEKHIDNKLSELLDTNGDLPTPLVHAMLLFIGNLYQSRESVAFNSSPIEIPLSYSYLLDLYKNYSNQNNVEL